MANKNLFASAIARLLPAANASNQEGAPAYAYGPEAKLAQLAATGTLADNFYGAAETQLSDMLEAARAVDPQFVAQTALYARKTGAMKDMPALLTAYLTVAEPVLVARIFARVIDNGRQLRSFVQIMRSGQVGRTSLGTRPKRLVQQWLERATMRDLMAAATGNDPSLKDIVRMVHPKPADAARKAFYAWLLDRPYDVAALPAEIAAFEAWKRDPLEVSLAKVEGLGGSVVVCPDVSGSMASPVTGYRKGASSKVRCIDVAALVTAAILRSNRTARVLPFEQKVVDVTLDPFARIAANAEALAAIGGGGTNVSAPLAKLNATGEQVDLVVIVSDNQSWVDANRGGATATIHEWDRLKRRNAKAKLVCIDLQPYGTTQASGRSEILNVGGFSDAVFETLARFVRGETRDWVELVKQTEV